MFSLSWAASPSMVLAASLTISPAAAVPAPPTPKDLRVSVAVGDYFSTKYKVRVSDRQANWDTEWLRIEGNGLARKWRKADFSTRLKPGTYRLTWRTRIGWLGLVQLVREGGATVTFEGDTKVTKTKPRNYWEYDPTADPAKGLSYWSQDSAFDIDYNEAFGPTAIARGAQYLGKILCLRQKSDGRYNYSNAYGGDVFVSASDPRLYKPEPSKGWEPTVLGWNAEDTGGWTKDGTNVQLPCKQSYFPGDGLAFRTGQEPDDASQVANTILHIYALPDGNVVQRTEQLPSDGTWSGVVTAVDLQGNAFRGTAHADALQPTIKNVRVGDVRLVKRGARPVLESRTTSMRFTVRPRNNKCATAREGKAIRLGMTLGQVRNIIGSRGYLDVRGAVTVRSWLGCGPDLTIGFVGGRVASVVYS